jgi:glycerophosphoryl diester phosphodiesterase
MTPKIYAHRGASGDAPENTLAAFDLAVAQNADGIELDVTLSNDGEVVVIHDDTVDRTTNGKGYVRDMTLSQLKELNAGQGERLPTLDEVLKRFGDKIIINIELKRIKPLTGLLPIKVAALINQYQLRESVLVSSFSPRNLRNFRKHSKDVALGLLTLPRLAKKWFWRWFDFDALHPHHSDVTQTLVQEMHQKNCQVNVWTVDEPDEITRLVTLNVDGIITNHPARTRTCLEALQ